MAHSASIKEKVLRMRSLGYSYTYISFKTGLSKSTLSEWLSHVPYSPNKETILKIGKARAASGEKKAQLKLLSIKEAKFEAVREMGSVKHRDMFMLGLGLYIGEGCKTYNIVGFTNSDPKVLQLAMGWFLALGVPKENFVIK